MVKFFGGVVCVVLCMGVVFGGDVPGITPAEFAASDPASWFWEMLAGFGPWGALVAAVVGVVWRFAKPYLDAWMTDKRMTMLWDAVTTGVLGMLQTYVDKCKELSPDGKLTEEQAAYARKAAKDYAVKYMASQGVDIVKHYGDAVIDLMIEAILRRLKIDTDSVIGKLAKVVAVPLPELQP